MSAEYPPKPQTDEEWDKYIEEKREEQLSNRDKMVKQFREKQAELNKHHDKSSNKIEERSYEWLGGEDINDKELSKLLKEELERKESRVVGADVDVNKVIEDIKGKRDKKQLGFSKIKNILDGDKGEGELDGESKGEESEPESDEVGASIVDNNTSDTLADRIVAARNEELRLKEQKKKEKSKSKEKKKNQGKELKKEKVSKGDNKNKLKNSIPEPKEKENKKIDSGKEMRLEEAKKRSTMFDNRGNIIDWSNFEKELTKECGSTKELNPKEIAEEVWEEKAAEINSARKAYIINKMKEEKKRIISENGVLSRIPVIKNMIKGEYPDTVAALKSYLEKEDEYEDQIIEKVNEYYG